MGVGHKCTTLINTTEPYITLDMNNEFIRIALAKKILDKQENMDPPGRCLKSVLDDGVRKCIVIDDNDAITMISVETSRSSNI